MLRLLALILLLPLAGYAQEKKILTQDYNFLVIDGIIKKLHQSKDTLFEFHCYIDRPCLTEHEKIYKIVSSQKSEEFTILKLASFDNILPHTDTVPTTRNLILALRSVDNKQLGYLLLTSVLTRKQLDTTRINVQSLKDKFFLTFYSNSYLKELLKLKRVTTKEQANEIMDWFSSDAFKPLIESYKKTEISDMYGSGLAAEMLHRACIDKGYNPIGASDIIERLLGPAD